MSQENDILYAYGDSKGVTTFTENNVLKRLGLTSVTLKELKDLVEPSHLSFICEMFGLDTAHLYNGGLQEKLEIE